MAILNNSFLLDPEDLLTASALTVSGGATPSVTSSARQISKITKVQVFVANGGASTNTTVTIKGKPSASSTMEEVLAVFTLGATGTASAKAGRYIENPPSYIWAVAANADPANAATVTVTLNLFR